MGSPCSLQPLSQVNELLGRSVGRVRVPPMRGKGSVTSLRVTLTDVNLLRSLRVDKSHVPIRQVMFVNWNREDGRKLQA